MKRITVLGGGTGTFVALAGLKRYSLDLAAIVTMMDSGGSTGKLRDQLGVLPPGDLRQCLVALSEASDLWRKLFLYRFEKGDLKGHNFGNIFLSALEKVSDNYNEVIENASLVLKTRGKVIPVTFESTHMCVEYENGKIIKGEGNISDNVKEEHKIIKAFLEPKVSLNADARARIRESNYILIGPGGLYTSIIPILLTGSLKSELKKAKGKIIYVMNLMTKAGQTTKYTAYDHLADLTKYLGRQPDSIIVNNSKVQPDIIKWYEAHGEHPVLNDLNKNNYKGTIFLENIIEDEHYSPVRGDLLQRSILRHNSFRLAAALMKVIE